MQSGIEMGHVGVSMESRVLLRSQSSGLGEQEGQRNGGREGLMVGVSRPIVGRGIIRSRWRDSSAAGLDLWWVVGIQEKFYVDRYLFLVRTCCLRRSQENFM